ncbi:hypothetical protein CONLIGDRAFT_666662 [Coniochaeta ligniaria NRRL 30616]|uniref:Uncharacterized protein n=1 Tax=Coniochaeta ligniaria NRRL 30616 TaxID=1408157 RepID=A0A1J7IZY3_9PEZI|nr:hypothetical protein CONLIGDRAFT_666662 [Coniochaeta ligniaria NRRL 30616]
MKASIFNILAVLAFGRATLALPAAEAAPAPEVADGGVSIDSIICPKDFKDTTPHAREVATRTGDAPSGTVDGYVVRRACFDYACDDNTDCKAAGCTTCIQTHTPCGDAVNRCR